MSMWLTCTCYRGTIKKPSTYFIEVATTTMVYANKFPEYANSDFIIKKYGSVSYGLNKLYLMLETQHNRGQDGAGFASVKLNMKPGQRFMHRERSANQNPIQEIFKLANENLIKYTKENSKFKGDIVNLKKNVPHVSELFLTCSLWHFWSKQQRRCTPFLKTK